MLAAAKKQAVVFLVGLEHELLMLPDPTDRAALQQAIEHKGALRPQTLDFSIIDLYLFDGTGAVLAHLKPEPHPDKDLAAGLNAILTQARPHVDEENETYQDPVSGRSKPKADIILPLDLPGLGRVGLEVEIGLDETMAMIASRDDVYERAELVQLVVVTLLLLLFIGWVVHRGLLRPIRTLEQVTARIAAGDLDARVEGVTARHELGRLGRSVNQMAEGLQQLMAEQENAYMQMMQALAKALETKDAYTAGHSGRVAKYATLLARRVGYDAAALKVLQQGALMHDLGKIGIPDAILNKPGALTESEYEHMQRHPAYTAAIMRPLRKLQEHAAIAAWHHERWDGCGYPDGLRGEAIPLSARIVAIADTWDAMTGDRVYRKGMPVERAWNILKSERDHGQFDPVLLDQFLEMVKETMEAHRVVRRDAGMAEEEVAAR